MVNLRRGESIQGLCKCKVVYQVWKASVKAPHIGNSPPHPGLLSMHLDEATITWRYINNMVSKSLRSVHNMEVSHGNKIVSKS